jgi:hypothetical protein
MAQISSNHLLAAPACRNAPGAQAMARVAEARLAAA